MSNGRNIAIFRNGDFMYLHGVSQYASYIMIPESTEDGIKLVPHGPRDEGTTVHAEGHGTCELWLPLQGKRLAEFNAMKGSIIDSMFTEITDQL